MAESPYATATAEASGLVSLPVLTTAPQATEASEPPPRWNPLTRVAFRFGFSAWIFLGFGIASGVVAQAKGALLSLFFTIPTAGPGVEMPDPWWLKPLGWPAQGWYSFWYGKSGMGPKPAEIVNGWRGMDSLIAALFPGWIVGDPRPQQGSGSGDQLHNWIEVGTCVAAAAAVGAVWSAIDWRRPSYPRLHAVLRLWLRVVLASVLLGYGFAKAFPSQFSLPAVGKLMQTYGESSPMGLLWTFMGASPAYTIFSGCMEVLGGVLLLFRCTTLLGSLVTIAVMTNVFALNMCYDVPVKLYSAMYLLMAVTLAAPDAPRLFCATVLHRATPRVTLRRKFRKPWLNWAWRVVALGIATWLIWTHASSGWETYKMASGSNPGAGFGGTYQVTRFLRDGVAPPMLITDGSQWKRAAFVEFGATGYAGIRALNDVNQRFSLTRDEAAHTLTLKPMPGKSASPRGETDEKVIASAEPVTLSYSEPEPGTMVVEGTVDGAALKVTMTRLDRSGFLLMNRGFHWVSPFHFNR